MEGENHQSHIKDTPPLPVLYSGQGIYLEFWARANKLVTALYMVTDVMDTSEPLRIKLRSLGADMLSDIYNNSTQTEAKISGVLSFLNIASMVGMISEMNWGILTNEFNKLLEGIKRSRGAAFGGGNNKLSLEDFLKEEEEAPASSLPKYISHDIGHTKRTRVGVQKGGTLMRVLSDRISDMSTGHADSEPNFDVLKKERRQEIVDIIKGHKGKSAFGEMGLNITEIKSLARGALATCGNKTLQRELVSMVKDGILAKIGEKRWSKYSLR